ncbi:uncharacterized protein N7511_008177 [Penicillium nucicola]|uniref:uncharacterized protein n=1 Tax=Penicillium nucicola TaxID=1850975 RepID=UPI0025451D8C|nr:uncharacterized protein N7511_008177 [Penicillium nucicola]KAJ5754024.1 hypothetical protein N7511_008177 [Penicillium nucicola]
MAPDGKWDTALAKLGLKRKPKISDPIPKDDVFSVTGSHLCVRKNKPHNLHVTPPLKSPTGSSSDTFRTPTSSSSISGSWAPLTPLTPTSFDSVVRYSLDPVKMATGFAQARLATFLSDDQDRVATHDKWSKECLDSHLLASMAMMDEIVDQVTPQNVVQSRLRVEDIRDGFFRYADALGHEADLLRQCEANGTKPLSKHLPISYPAETFNSPKTRPTGIIMDPQVELLPPPWRYSKNPKPFEHQPDTSLHRPEQQTDDIYAGMEPKIMKKQISGLVNSDTFALPFKTSDVGVQTTLSRSSKDTEALTKQQSQYFEKNSIISQHQKVHHYPPKSPSSSNNEPKTLKQQLSRYFGKDSVNSKRQTANHCLPTSPSISNHEPKTLKSLPSQEEISRFSGSSAYSVRASGDQAQQLSDSSMQAQEPKKLPTGSTKYEAIGLKKTPFEDFDPEFIKALNLSAVLPVDKTLPAHEESLDLTANDFVPSLQGSGPRTYTVSSNEWIMAQSIPSPLSPTKVVAHGLNSVDEMIHRGVVMRIFIKLYTTAKLMQTILLGYGVEMGESSNGLMFWIKRSEENIKCHKITVLIDIVENLYYVLYARIVIELANIELCSLAEDENAERRAHSRAFLLPSAEHLYRIVLAFKDVMDSRQICAMLRKDVVENYQRQFIKSATEIIRKKGEALYDRFGYRRYVLGILLNKEGSYYQKWSSLIPFFDRIAPSLIVLLSDKYRTVDQVTVLPEDITYDDLPFIEQGQLGPVTWADETLKDNRDVSLARLNHICIGEQRRRSSLFRPYWLTKEHKCICLSTCRCCDECTADISRHCPCAERHVRFMTVIRTPNYNKGVFLARANTVARMSFYGLSFLKHDVSDQVIMEELETGFEMVEVLISQERCEPVRPTLRNTILFSKD